MILLKIENENFSFFAKFIIYLKVNSINLLGGLFMIYQSSNPYPIPKVEKENMNYALILLDNYCGGVSEETAIHQYLYEYFMMNNEFQEFADVMLKISKVEMMHLRLLGETIKLLGVVPVYGTVKEDNSYKSWCSNNVDYSINVKEIILNNIRYEEEAIKNYKRCFSLINDVYVRELINRIIEDEVIHIDIFNYFYNKITNFS